MMKWWLWVLILIVMICVRLVIIAYHTAWVTYAVCCVMIIAPLGYLLFRGIQVFLRWLVGRSRYDKGGIVTSMLSIALGFNLLVNGWWQAVVCIIFLIAMIITISILCRHSAIKVKAMYEIMKEKSNIGDISLDEFHDLWSRK